MPKIGNTISDHISKIESQYTTKKNALTTLIAIPFDISNETQLKALKKYIDDFEPVVYRHYAHQFMTSKETTILGLGLSVPMIFYLPFTAIYCCALSAAVIAMILKTPAERGFYDELQDMKTLYNWALKGGNQQYSKGTEYTKAIENQEIQRMIKLMAPLLPKDFMQAWEPVADTQELGAIAAVRNYLFKPSANSLAAHELKLRVQNDKFSLNASAGVHEVITYITKLATKIKQSALEEDLIADNKEKSSPKMH